MIPKPVLIPCMISRERLHLSLIIRRRKEVVVLALLAPEDPLRADNGRIGIEWRVGTETESDRRLREQVVEQLDFLLLEKGEPRPWSYLLHHCGSSANFHSFEGGGIGWRIEQGWSGEGRSGQP